MSNRQTSLTDLSVIFLIAFLSIILSFLCIDILFSIFEWIVTGKLNITWNGVSRVLFMGCVIGSFIGVGCVIARCLGLKGF
ncbi:hypothetical protein HVY04_04840 [Citrobacter freundii]|jgi:hypothetical protein|uniref:hypothetical protein n=1 Tax=Citrobacter freundii TaxID=546 RepID=UPI0015E9C92F|nr:hypothetical protein [Citrobacter freundii]QLS07316.1 hypothetical protein HV327_17705 [Citrobacter freundii]QMJ02472.1 hypothetical protein HVY06_04840 [Citrobacter freundii]QMJ11542.1 hypothetical protein HVY04_04840 [Citrobacter freundii]